MNNINNHIVNHRIIPPERSWKLLKEKMAKRKARQKLAFYRNLSIAAGLIAIVSFTFGFSEYIFSSDGNVFATNHLHEPIVLEDLPLIQDDPFYSYDKILVITKVNETEMQEFKKLTSPVTN
jgi:hypothetical protein